jgi:hypothetical protein
VVKQLEHSGRVGFEVTFENIGNEHMSARSKTESEEKKNKEKDL